MTNPLSRAKLQARRRVHGELVLDTALHLGGGRNPAKGTDSPIVRDGFGRPFIPGSSIKGAVRAVVERLVPNLQISACGLYDREADCLSALPETDPRRETFRDIQEAFGKPLNSSLKEKLSALLQGTGKSLNNLPDSREVTEEDLLFLLDLSLCDVCKTFGSPFISAAIFFHDAPVHPEKWVGLTQVRDGVGIDRDSGRAVDGLKYDYEVVPPQTVFQYSMTIETGDALGLGLAALALHELKEGNVPLGGIRTRGLGRCHLDQEKTFVESLELGDLEALKAYLTTGKIFSEPINAFVEKHISKLWTSKEGNHV
ncbi:CRISPR-associated RAMP protein Csx7 [candidate division KSB1 bacterium]|nr:CRISPR-associated RAMP protein Csx7 [candidate division KSB1 bacterium]